MMPTPSDLTTCRLRNCWLNILSATGISESRGWGQSSSLTRAERVGGYCTTLLKYGLPFHSDWVLECSSSQKQAAEEVTALLRRNPTISAVVCYNETIAVGAGLA